MGRKSSRKKRKKKWNKREHDPIQEAIDDFKKHEGERKYTIPEVPEEDFKQRLLKAYQRTEGELREKISQLLDIFKTYNPLSLLPFFSKDIFLFEPGKLREKIDSHYEVHIEYVLSLATAIENPKIDTFPEDKTLFSTVKELTNEIFRDTFYLFLVEGSKYIPDYEKFSIRYENALQHLYLRGDSFPDHQVELIREQFASQNDFFQNNIGFAVDKVIDIFLNIIKQVNQDAQNYQQLFEEKLLDIYKIFCEFIDTKEAEGTTDRPLIYQEYLSTPAHHQAQKLLDELNTNIFLIKPSASIPEPILERLSLTFGSNKSFIDNPYFSGFPLGDSLIHKKPLIKHGNQYYCFAPHLLQRRMTAILEKWIKEGKQKQYERYQKRKATFLEQKAISYFKSIFPTAEVYHSLKYQTKIDEEDELDGLLLYDNNMFLIEAKANAFTLPARRGSIPRVKRDIGYIVEEAYQQALRAKRYIVSESCPTFYTTDGKTIVLNNKEKYENIYLVNVTLENLWHLTADVNALRYFNYVSDEGWIWSVFINDLRVISEIIDTPSEFLLYLQRRLKINEHPEISAVDELDLFGYFLQTGLYFDDVEFIDGMNFTIGPSFTHKIEEYYYASVLYGHPIEKPKFVISEELRNFVKKLEATQKDGFSKITTAILDLDGTIHEELMEYFRMLLNSALESPSMSNFVFPFSEANWGLMAVVNYHSDLKAFEKHCLKNCYLHKVTNWFLILLDVKEKADYDIDFKIFEQQWKFDPEMEKEVEELRLKRVVKYIAEHGELGRNDPCPCFSGKKYKKCCQRKVELLAS